MRCLSVFILSLTFVAASMATATEYPISEKLIRGHFYHDALHGKLETALMAENKRFKQLDAQVMRFKGAKAVIPFSHAKWKVHYTPEQVKIAKEQGWVETWRFAAINLKEKQLIWNWYHAFKAKAKGKQLTLNENGYRFVLKYQIYGPGARDAVMHKIDRAMRKFWQGSVHGKPFATQVDISLRRGDEKEQPDAMQVYIGAEGENIWPTYMRLPYHVDAETIAHEFGHGLGFTDRYRDVYSFEQKFYRSYQWDLFALMSAQNGPDPVVSEKDLMQLIKHYMPRPAANVKTGTER